MSYGPVATFTLNPSVVNTLYTQQDNGNSVQVGFYGPI